MLKIFRNTKLTYLNLAFLIFFSFFYVGCNFDKKMTQLTEEEIQKSPDLKALNNMCNQIPLPEDFQFIRKGGLDDQRITFTNLYYSETEYDKARKLFEEYFSNNNWKLTKEDKSYPKTIEFRNDKYRVVIQHEGIGKKTNYGITCEKLSQYSH